MVSPSPAVLFCLRRDGGLAKKFAYDDHLAIKFEKREHRKTQNLKLTGPTWKDSFFDIGVPDLMMNSASMNQGSVVQSKSPNN